MAIEFSGHALRQIQERGITAKVVFEILENPGQLLEVSENRRIAQSIRIEEGNKFFIQGNIY